MVNATTQGLPPLTLAHTSLHSRVDEVELVRMPLDHHSEVAPRGGLLDPTGDLDGLAPATGGRPPAISAAAAVGVALVRSGGALIGSRPGSVHGGSGPGGCEVGGRVVLFGRFGV